MDQPTSRPHGTQPTAGLIPPPFVMSQEGRFWNGSLRLVITCLPPGGRQTAPHPVAASPTQNINRGETGQNTADPGSVRAGSGDGGEQPRVGGAPYGDRHSDRQTDGESVSQTDRKSARKTDTQTVS